MYNARSLVQKGVLWCVVGLTSVLASIFLIQWLNIKYLIHFDYFLNFRRPHNHPGCTKNFPSMKLNFELKPASAYNKTDYQSTFKDTSRNPPAKMIKPLPSTLNPNPPLMDFRTTNRLAFKDLPNEGRTQPCKVN